MGGIDEVWGIGSIHPKDAYNILPSIYLGLGIAWAVVLLLWIANTYSRRHWQTLSLQWSLVPIPLLKLIVTGLSFVFWYSCLHNRSCSFWVAFGVYVARIFLETSCLVVFLLLAFGYCVTQEHLTVGQQRSVSVLSLLFYLLLTGHRAALPLSSLLLSSVYAALFALLWRQVGVLLHTIRDGLHHLTDLSARYSDDHHAVLKEALQSKMVMFSDFRAALLGLLLVEIAAWVLTLLSPSPYWVRVLFRECGETLVFGFIGWTFRPRPQSPFFYVFPAVLTAAAEPLAPICRIEVESGQWHLGVVRGAEGAYTGTVIDLSILIAGWAVVWWWTQPASPFAGVKRSFFVIIQNPNKFSNLNSPTPMKEGMASVTSDVPFDRSLCMTQLGGDGNRICHPCNYAFGEEEEGPHSPLCQNST